MESFYIWLELSRIGVWVRESLSIFAFPGIIALHAVGMAFVAGINAAVSLRVLGFAPGVPLPAMRKYFPVMWLGFAVNAFSGVLLYIAYPAKATTNPVFHIKLALILLGLLILRPLWKRIRIHWDEGKSMPLDVKLLAGASLFCWTAAVVAGRALAYTYTRLLAF